MNPKNTTKALLQNVMIALFNEDEDAITRIAADAVEQGMTADEVGRVTAIARFDFDEKLTEYKSAPAEPLPEAEALTLTKASDVQQRDVDWLWPGWLPRGELTLLAGAPKTGKTTLALSVASILSRAGKWPSGERAKKADTIFWDG